MPNTFFVNRLAMVWAMPIHMQPAFLQASSPWYLHP